MGDELAFLLTTDDVQRCVRAVVLLPSSVGLAATLYLRYAADAAYSYPR